MSEFEYAARKLVALLKAETPSRAGCRSKHDYYVQIANTAEIYDKSVKKPLGLEFREYCSRLGEDCHCQCDPSTFANCEQTLRDYENDAEFYLARNGERISLEAILALL